MADPASAASPPSPPPEERPRIEAPWSWVDAVLVFLIAMAVVLPAGRLLAERVSPVATIPFSTAVLALVTVVLVRVRYGVGAPRLLLGDGPLRWRDVGVGAATAVGAYIVINVGLSLLLSGRELPQVQEGLRDAALDPRTAVLIGLTALVVGPIGEELFFRGLLFQGLRRSMGLWPAIGVSSVVFALAHVQGTLAGTLLLFVAFFPLGMFFAWLFDRRRSLLAPIAGHATYNGLSFALLYVAAGAADSLG